MHNPASVLENDTRKLLGDFDIQTDHQKTRPHSNQQKKRTCKIVDLPVPANHRIKLKESEKELGNWKKKTRDMKVTIKPIVIGAFGKVTKWLLKGLMSPGDLRRLAVAQTPVKDHQLMLMWKILKENK